MVGRDFPAATLLAKAATDCATSRMPVASECSAFWIMTRCASVTLASCGVASEGTQRVNKN